MRTAIKRLIKTNDMTHKATIEDRGKCPPQERWPLSWAKLKLKARKTELNQERRRRKKLCTHL